MDEVAKVVVVDRLAGEPWIWGRDGQGTCAAGEEGDIHWLFGAEDLGCVSSQPDVGSKEEERRPFDEDEASQPGAIRLAALEDERPAQHSGGDHDYRHCGAAERRHIQGRKQPRWVDRGEDGDRPRQRRASLRERTTEPRNSREKGPADAGKDEIPAY